MSWSCTFALFCTERGGHTFDKNNDGDSDNICVPGIPTRLNLSCLRLGDSDSLGRYGWSCYPR
jgi:hypothetical protein